MSAISTNPATINLVSTILALSPENDGGDSEKDDWQSLYTLRLSMLPSSYIPRSFLLSLKHSLFPPEIDLNVWKGTSMPF